MTTTPLEFEPIKELEVIPEALNVPDNIQAEPKKKRGRPKKTEFPKENNSDTKSIKPENPSDIFEQIRKEVNDNERNLANSETGNLPTSPIHEAAKNVIDGYMLLVIADTFFPFVLKTFFKKSKRLKDSDIRLNKDQKEHLTPIADEVAQSLLSWLDPFTLFFVLTGAMYYMNMEDAISRLPDEKK